MNKTHILFILILGGYIVSMVVMALLVRNPNPSCYFYYVEAPNEASLSALSAVICVPQGTNKEALFNQIMKVAQENYKDKPFSIKTVNKL